MIHIQEKIGNTCNYVWTNVDVYVEKVFLVGTHNNFKLKFLITEIKLVIQPRINKVL